MNRSEFEARLKVTYDGAIIPLNAYTNENAVACFKCNKCGLVFFGKASHLVGKEHQQHRCRLPYGDRNGTRKAHVKGVYKTKKKSARQQQAILDNFNSMVWNDFTYQQIAQELKVNPLIIKDHFEREGLI